MQSVLSVGEKFPASMEAQFLRDMDTIVGRIGDLVEGDRVGRPHSERTLIALLELVLTMESTFAVWCWRHVHLERVSPGSAGRISLRSRAEAAVEDADRIAESLHRLTETTTFRLEWLPSAIEPVSGEGWILNGAIRDRIALAADRIALETYGKLIEYTRKWNSPISTLLENIAYARKTRLAGESVS